MSDGSTFLFEEHQLLGASMEELEGTGLLLPMSYPGEELGHETILADLTGLPYALLSGSDALTLAEMACAGPLLSVGECSFEAVLFGDGRLVGTPLVFRTGDSEYCILDLASKNDACMEWLLGLSLLSQGSERVFVDANLEDASEMLVPLLIKGAQARLVLSDYLSEDARLPEPGKVRTLALDRIQALVAAPQVLEDTFIVLVPPARARALWRSFLSFPFVQPIGFYGLREMFERELPWYPLLESSEPAHAPVLAMYGLIRDKGQFVGMRGLLEG